MTATQSVHAAQVDTFVSSDQRLAAMTGRSDFVRPDLSKKTAKNPMDAIFIKWIDSRADC
jgi:hypothetical protein